MLPCSESLELQQTVRRVADDLVARLAWAERQTDRWTNRDLADALVDAALTECLDRLAATGCWGESNRIPSGQLWEVAGSLLQTGAMQRQAREKPRGYAGDYDLLAKICVNWCCDHPLGRAFDRYFQRLAAPQAVRARTELIAAWIAQQCLRRFDQGRACRLVSVGSGPAMDVSNALAMLPNRDGCSVTLLDLDPEALDDAQRRLAPLVEPGAVVSRRENLFRLAQRRDPAELLGTPDFLVCSGLFDYLADAPAQALLSLFWQRLAPGGQLVVGNFAPHNPTRAYMEWIGNWYLLYRSPEQMRRLGLDAGIPSRRMTITAERTGVDLLLVAEKDEADN